MNEIFYSVLNKKPLMIDPYSWPSKVEKVPARGYVHKKPSQPANDSQRVGHLSALRSIEESNAAVIPYAVDRPANDVIRNGRANEIEKSAWRPDSVFLNPKPVGYDMAPLNEEYAFRDGSSKIHSFLEKPIEPYSGMVFDKGDDKPKIDNAHLQPGLHTIELDDVKWAGWAGKSS